MDSCRFYRPERAFLRGRREIFRLSVAQSHLGGNFKIAMLRRICHEGFSAFHCSPGKGRMGHVNPGIQYQKRNDEPGDRVYYWNSVTNGTRFYTRGKGGETYYLLEGRPGHSRTPQGLL